MTSLNKLRAKHEQEIHEWVRDTLTEALGNAGHDVAPREVEDRTRPTYRAAVGQHDVYLTSKQFIVSNDWYTEDKGEIFSVKVPLSVPSPDLPEKMAHLIDLFLDGEAPAIDRLREAVTFMGYARPVSVELDYGVDNKLVQVTFKDWKDKTVATTSLMTYVRDTEEVTWSKFQGMRPELELGAS